MAATAAALDPNDFVAGRPIEAPAGAEVFDVPLTAEIYGAAASSAGPRRSSRSGRSRGAP